MRTAKYNLYRRRGLFVLLLVAGFSWFAFRLLGPDPALIISPETTYIAAPVAVDGLPDYFEYVRSEARRGVTPQNNAAALLWQAIGPNEAPEKSRKEFFAELGIDPPIQNDSNFRSINDEELIREVAAWLKEINWTPPADFRENSNRDSESLDSTVEEPWMLGMRREAWFRDFTKKFMERPWRSEDIPPLAAWLHSNEFALDMAVEASQRPHFYSPMVFDPTWNDPPLLCVDLSTIEITRSLVRGLQIRAMRHAGEGRLMESHQDIMACRRLARLVGQCPYSIAGLVACGIEHSALTAHNSVFAASGADLSVCKQINCDLVGLSPLWDVNRSIDHNDRILVLGNVAHLIRQMRGNVAVDASESKRFDLPMLSRARIDWNEVLRRFNEVFDCIKEIGEERDTARRESLSDKLDELEIYVDQIDDDPMRWLKGCFSMPFRTKLIFAKCFTGFMPTFGVIRQASHRNAARATLAQTAAALAEYHAKHNSFPARLDALVPEFQKEAPIDPFLDKPLRYETRGDGYLLYSVGSDREDQGGDDVNGEIVDGEWVAFQGDATDYDHDYVIRVPLPPLELPMVDNSAGDDAKQ